MPTSADQTMEVPAVIHLRSGPGFRVACGGPDGLWARDLLLVTCPGCHAVQAVTRPLPAEPDRARPRRAGKTS